MERILQLFCRMTVLFIVSFLSLVTARAQTEPCITFKFDPSVAQDGSPYKFTGVLPLLIVAEDAVVIKSNGIENLQDWKNGEWVSYELKSQDPDQPSFDVEIYGTVTSFKITDALVTQVDVLNCPQLKILSCSMIPLNSIDLSKNLELEYLRCSSTQVLDLSLVNNKKLQYVDCSASNLQSLELKELKELRFLDCSYNNLRDLNLAANTKIQTLRCSNNPLSNLDLSMLTELEGITCSQTNLSSLDLSRAKKLNGVILNNNQNLETLVVSTEFHKAEDLAIMDVSSNALRELDVTGLDKLFSIFLERNKMDGEATSRFIQSLPDHSYPHPINNNKLCIIDTQSDKEENVCYEEDVRLAWEKGWLCEDYNGGQPIRYMGSKPIAAEVVQSEQVRLYPNPMSSNLQIRGAEAFVEVILFTVEGVAIMNAKCNEDGAADFDVSHLPQGSYLVKVGERSIPVIRK
ncbi:T9SS type A sorting domain-containing protein [Porphyromonas crevioricanis]|nr:T9SS type A sorting domain-containing protein [Porphyromonas crevioricanis]